MRLRIKVIDMKWDWNEWKNQFKHFTVGLIATGVAKFVFGIVDWRLLLIGVSIGILVELYQFFFRDNKILHPLDRIRDVCFYDIGSLLIWMV